MILMVVNVDPLICTVVPTSGQTVNFAQNSHPCSCLRTTLMSSTVMQNIQTTAYRLVTNEKYCESHAVALSCGGKLVTPPGRFHILGEFMMRRLEVCGVKTHH